jgi:hypothetical protein
MPGVASDGVVYAAEAYLAPGARKRLTVPVLQRGFGGREWRITLRTDRTCFLRHALRSGEGRALTDAVGGSTPMGSDLQAQPPVIGLLGDPRRRNAWMGDEARYADGRRGRARRVNFGYVTPRLGIEDGPGAYYPQFAPLAPEAVPDTWLCFEGMDAILWVAPDPSALKDASQVDAILEYAACGGRLVVAWTPDAKVGASPALARALPATAAGFDEEPGERVLAAASGGTGEWTPPRDTVPVARLAETAGKVHASLPDGRPLVVSRSHGLGTVVVVAFDPALLRGAKEDDHARLLRVLFGPAVWADSPEERNPGIPQQATNLEPLVNHLRKRFLSNPPLGLLVLGLVLYVACIGPVDYFVLKRKGKLRRTVITFPIIVIAFTLLAYGASFLLFGGTSGQARVAVYDFATAPSRDADVVRGLDFSGSYSPTGTTLEVAYDLPRSFLGPTWLGGGAWWGGGDQGSLDGAVELGADGRPAGAFDLPLRSHRTVQARFSGEVPQSLSATVVRSGGAPAVEVHNTLGVRLRDAWVVHGRLARSLGNLEKDARVRVEIGQGPWIPLGSHPDLPNPYGGTPGQPLFQGGPYSFGPGRGGADVFVPEGPDAGSEDRARAAVARAVMGASVAGMFGPDLTGPTRILGRHGLDLSRPLREGRILVMGWCDADPLGALPEWRKPRSTTVVVRRVLPAEEGR